MFVSVDKKQNVVAISDTSFHIVGKETVNIAGQGRNWSDVVGKKLHNGGFVMRLPAKPIHELKVAVVCNWNDKCGISTYSKFLVDAMLPCVRSLKVFSEHTKDQTNLDEPFVDRCWKRGESLRLMLEKLLAWQPDFVIIQHEFGIFPNACYFFQMMQAIDEIPYIVMMHSVYDHLDKAVYSSVIKHIGVHSDEAKQCLMRQGIDSDITVIPHGCVQFPDAKELWNIMQNPYTILQFGFGFKYKGVERMLDAVAILKKTQEKFKNIFYTFLLSTNSHNSRLHNAYYESFMKKVRDLDIEDNVVVIRKYNSDTTLNNFLRLYKVAVFPYLSSSENVVYGATGAARVAMGNGIPVICSESHLFDDLEGVVPRPNSVEALAREIDEIFSNSKYRAEVLEKEKAYIEINSWPNMAQKYLQVYQSQCV